MQWTSLSHFIVSTLAAVLLASSLALELVHVGANRVGLGRQLDESLGDLGLSDVCSFTHQVNNLMQGLLLTRYPLARGSDCGLQLPYAKESFFIGQDPSMPAECGSDDECRLPADDGSSLWPTYS